MKNLIIILFILFGFSASAQDVTVIHFNYKWNDRNSYNIRGLKNAKLQYAWLEEQPESVKSGIKTVPVVVILKNKFIHGLVTDGDLRRELEDNSINSDLLRTLSCRENFVINVFAAN